MNNDPCPGCGWRTSHDLFCPRKGDQRDLSPKRGQVWKVRGTIRVLVQVVGVDYQKNRLEYLTEDKKIMQTGLQTFAAIHEPYVPNGLDVVLDLLDSI